jgi:hypothetical protein
VEHLRWGGSWREGKKMELVEGRNQLKQEGEEIELVAHIEHFS